MKLWRFWRVEFCRLVRNPLVWLAVAATAFGALSGFVFFSASTMASRYLAHQIYNACLCGTPIFALLTLWTMSRVQRCGADTVCDCVVSPVCLAVVRLAALLTVCLTATLMLMLLYAPFAVHKLGIVFSLADYVASFLVVLFPALAFGCVVAAACYQIIRRVEVSALLVAVFLLASGSGLCQDQYLWQWSLPFFSALSDDFSNAMVFRMAVYNRLVWLCLLGGIWAASLLCVRQYGKGVFGSLRSSLRKHGTVALAVFLLLGGGLLWQMEPFFDHSPVDWMTVQEKNHSVEGVSIVKMNTDVTIKNTLLGRLEAATTIFLRNTTGKEQILYFQLNSGYVVRSVAANGAQIAFEDLKDDYIAARNLRCTLPAEEEIKLEVVYEGTPKLWNLTQKNFGMGTIISGRYINLRGKSLAPLCEAETEENAVITMRLTLSAKLTPVTSGETPALITQNADGTATWLAKDMGETQMTLFAGDYNKVDLQGGGFPIEFYYSRKHKAQLEGMDAIKTMQEAVRYCTENYGPRSFKVGQTFKIVQGSELLFGGSARQNVSTMSEESFTVENLTNKEKGADGAQVLAHEIIHQWWGLGVMFTDPANPYWSEEGLTTYSTYRLLKELRGEQYADTHYKQAWIDAVKSNANHFYTRHPEYRDRLPEALRTELAMQTSSVMAYDGYALMFDRAAELLGGEDKLDAVLAKLYQEGGTEMPPYVTLGDFLNATGLEKEELNLA